MAIIDLATGSVQTSADTQGSEPTDRRPQGRIIDLESGSFVAQQTAEPVAEPQIDRDILAKSQALQTSRAIPDQATTPFPEEREETRAAQELPELGAGGLLAGEDQAKVAAIAPVILATPDPNELGKILSENFPNVGIQSDPGGNLIATNNSTGARVVINQPGLSQLDVLQGLGIAAAFTPAGRFAAAGPTLATKVAGGASAAALTQTAIEGIQSLVGGELDEEEVALATVLGGASETVVPAIQAIRQARRGKALDVARGEVTKAVEQIKPAREAQQAVQAATGVDVPLFQAQQTLQPSTLLKQRLIPQLDAGSKKAAAELENQNQQVFDATSELINTVAGPEVIETGSKNFRTAAQKVLDSAKESRRLATTDLYDEALTVGADVDLTTVRSMIDDLLADAPPGGEFEKTAERLLSKIKARKKGELPSLRQLQKAKIEMQDMIDAVGDKAVSGTLKREIAQIKKQLVDDMTEASPLFKSAEDEFKRLSPAITELNDSILGGIAKLDDAQLKNISGRIFDVRQTDPSVVRKAKILIDKADPNAWDDLMRVELQRRFGGIDTLAEDIPGELIGNLPGQLRRSIFGNPAQRKTLLAGMSPEQRKNFVYLDDILRRASSGRQAGSPTAAFGEVLDRLRGTMAVIRDAVFRPLETLRLTGDRGLFDRNVAKLTDVLFNPKWEPKLKELRALNPRSRKANQIMAELMAAAKGVPQVTEAPQLQEQQ